MANSKSNIYPIQLQGAELCLNRYDAEIKQYRGFNKNNSPFVGGCLSNVFEKDETIEGATDENTYIDTNGDKYTVDTEGLYKNGEKVLNFDNGTIFWEKEKINFPDKDNIIKLFTDEIWLKKRVLGNVTEYVLTFRDDKILTAYDIYTLVSDETEDFFLNHLNYINFTYNNTEFFVITRTLKTQTQNPYSFYYKNSNGYWRRGKYNFIASGGIGGLFFDKELGQILIQRTGVNSNSSMMCFGITEDLETPGEYSFSTIGQKNIDGATIDPVSSPTYKFYSDFTYLKYIDYPYNAFILNSQPSGNNSTVITAIPGMYKNPYYDSTSNKILFRRKFMLQMGNLGLYNWRNTLYNVTQEYIAKGTNTKLFKVYDWQISAKFGNSTAAWESYWTHFNPDELPDSLNAGLCERQNGTDVKNADWVAGDYIKLGNTFHAAFNNNILSGICGKYVLLTNWNTVDAESVIFVEKADGKEIVIFEDAGELYVLKQGSPKLKHGLNQIITNADSLQNSFDIVRNKKLFFAPALNSFKYYPLGRDPSQTDWYAFGAVLDSGALSTTTYIAVSLNEYALEDNCSLLLNPILVSIGSDYLQAVVGNLPDIYINVYSNRSPVFIKDTISVTYQFSSKFEDIYDTSTVRSINYKQINNPDLLNLPFPIDTNGNVQYSPCLFGKVVSNYGNMAFYIEGMKGYPLNVNNNNQNVFSFYLGSEIENFENAFIIQGQYYGVIGDNIFSMQYMNGIVSGISFVVSRKGLEFVGNTPYEALFFSKTNRCLYSFTGANVLNQKQLVDKISEVRNYLYNPATQTVFLITDIGVLFYGLFGMFLLEYTNISNIFLLNNGIALSDNNGNYRYIKYYLDEGDTDYTKENINVETSFYGMNNEVVTINDCLYFRIFSEEHEEGDLKVSATTISLSGRKTEDTTFKIKASDWDKITHTIYLRYQPKTQRGLGVAFAIDSPFKIASLSVGSQPDAVLVDKVSKGAITAPSVTTNNNEW